MNAFEGFENWIVTLADAPAAMVPADTVMNGLPLNVPVLFVIVTPGVRFVKTT